MQKEERKQQCFSEMCQSSRRLSSVLSHRKSQDLEQRQGDFKLCCSWAAGRFMRRSAAACPELSPRRLLPQLQRHNYAAGGTLQGKCQQLIVI